MKTCFDPQDPKAHDAPSEYRQWAIEQGKQLLKIVWDEADGYPEHAWDYVQWSIRPYEQWYGCDGTTDANIHLIAQRVCEALGLDYPALYEQAYTKENGYDCPCWLRGFDFTPYETETVVPPLPPSDEVLCGILHDLHDVNNHSLANLLEDVFASRGYDVNDYWLRRNESG